MFSGASWILGKEHILKTLQRPQDITYELMPLNSCHKRSLKSKSPFVHL